MTTRESPETKAAFCAALVVAGGNVTRACEAVGIHRTLPYIWREHDLDFASAWEKARQHGAEVLEDEARRRSFEGWDEPVFQAGVQCGTVRKYSDTLTVFLLKGAMPDRYRERVDSRISGGLSFSQLVDESFRGSSWPPPASLPPPDKAD